MKKLTKTLSLILCLSLILGVVSSKTFNVFASTSGTTGDCTWTLNGTELTISGNGEMAYYYNSFGEIDTPWGVGITSVIIENGVKNIGAYAFHDCTLLESITISDSVTSIDDSAFFECTSLKSITIPNSVTSIGYSAFFECTSLTSVTIPNGIKSIAGQTFYGCTSLKSITIPDGVTSIGSYAFGYCTLLESITIPNSITNIENDAFTDTAWLDNQADGPIYINNILYCYKGDCPSNVIIKDGTIAIVDSAFFSSGLESITIPDSVTSIGNYVFAYCNLLKSITIPNGVTSIGSGAFWGCINLAEVINFSSLNITAGSEDYGYVAYYAKKVIGSQTTVLCDNATAKQNETVTLDLKLKRNAGFMALNLAIIYDKENLELTNIENKLAGFMMSADSSIVWDGSKDYTEDGTIATLTFKVKENASYGDYQIKVNFFEASDYDGNDIQMDTVSGKIKVCGTEIIKGDLNEDGNVDDDDFCILRRALLYDQEYSGTFDINSDESLDILDLICIKKCIKEKNDTSKT